MSVEASPGLIFQSLHRSETQLLPATRESDEIGSVLYQEAIAHAPKFSEKRFRTFATELMQKVDKRELNLVLDEGARTYHVTAESPDDDVVIDPRARVERPDMLPTLHIRNKTEFMKAVAHVSRFIGPGRDGYGGTWASRQDPLTLFRNATPDDFEHPERFLAEQSHTLEDISLEKIRAVWLPTGTLSATGEQFFLKKESSHHEKESAYELQFRLGSDETDELPAVQYARVTPDTAIVYAVQMPFINDHSQKQLEEEIKRYADKDGSLAATFAKFPQRAEKLKRINPHLARSIKDKSGIEIGRVPNELASAPPAAVVSLTAGLEVLRESGVQEVKIPLFLPWRQHMNIPEFNDPEGEIAKRVLEQNVRLIQRVMHEVDGIDMTSSGEVDGYIHLRLSDLQSNRPILSEVIDLVRKASIIDEQPFQTAA